MRLLFLYYICIAAKNNLYQHSGVLETFKTDRIFINSRETSTMLNLRFAYDIGKNEPKETINNHCIDEDYEDYSEPYREQIRTHIKQTIENKADSTLIGNKLQKNIRARRGTDTELIFQ